MTQVRTEQLVDEVVELVTARDYVTIREIQNRLAGRIPVEGDLRLALGDSNIWFAFQVSEQLGAVMEAVRRDGRVVAEPTSLLMYLVDGCAVPTRMPLGRRPPKGAGYKHPHFVPVAFRLRAPGR